MQIEGKKSRFPDALVLIFSMVVLAQIATYFLPPGEYERELVETTIEGSKTVELPAGAGITLADGQTLVPGGGVEITIPEGARENVPGRKVKNGTYHRVEAEKLAWHAALTKVPVGMEKAAEIIFFVMIVGGVIAVVRKTGAIDAVIGTAIHHLAGSRLLLIAGMVSLFAIGSSTIGMAEEYLPFVPILVAMCLALKMDAIVALAIVYVGYGVGYGVASLNPFTIMIAKDISGQDPSIGFWQRWALLAILLVIGVHHVLRYAKKIEKDPTASLVYDVDYTMGYDMPEDVKLTGPRMVVIAAFAGMIGLFVWGVNVHDWYLIELAALFLGLALVSAIVARLSPNEVSHTFLDGAAELAGTAIIIGFARTIEVILVDAKVIDTVIHGIASVLTLTDGMGAMSSVLAAWGMLAVQSICNFLIPSGSGQAFVTMPIMAPLADITGVGRETAILAYQMGDGLTNIIVPTNAVLMGMLLLGRIPYQRWARFVLPLLGKFYVVCLAALAWAAIVKWQ
jgi:uncharacterized ion transporter superfamily protein YfcC